ncbi:MAG TPA: serine hydrolase domain-containing protein, partial [Thermomicrobiales bacterium]|nr:serine hydrolase domain-containing protein [Thermomicrobiales bacterium]
LALIRAMPPAYPPGAQTRYSDSNYILLGFVVERVTGRPAAEVIADRVIRPLGLNGTTFPTTPDMPPPFMRGYAAPNPGDPLRDVTRSNPNVAWTAGAMISALDDLRVWAKALAVGTLLSPAMQRERLTWNRFASPSFDVGYGLGVLQINGLIGHNGGILGYSSWMLYDPDSGFTLVAVTNRAATEGGTADPIFYGIARLLLPDRFPPLTATPAASPSAATPVA